jgi:uncharacterized RDD family membrane protein YckC
MNAGLLHTRGQTVGKLAVATRIVRRDGKRATFWYLIGFRYLPIWAIYIAGGAIAQFAPSSFTALEILLGTILLANFLLIFRPSRACLHDDIAGTKVISTTPDFVPVQRWQD